MSTTVVPVASSFADAACWSIDVFSGFITEKAWAAAAKAKNLMIARLKESGCKKVLGETKDREICFEKWIKVCGTSRDSSARMREKQTLETENQTLDFAKFRPLHEKK